MLKRGCHYGSKPTTFSVLNSINEIIDSLPRNPQESSFALLKRSCDNSPKPLRYSPYRVERALRWLCENNAEYTDIQWNGSWVNDTEAENVDGENELPFIELEEDDFEGIEDQTDDIDAPLLTELLLHQDEKDYNTEEQIQRIIVGNNKAPTLTRSRGEYCPDYKTIGFLQKAFIRCYPYGKSFTCIRFLTTTT